MARKTLTKIIEKLISWIGKNPPPTLGDIKGELVTALPLSEALEDGEAIREAEAKIKAAETALKKSEAALEKSKAQNTKLEAQLRAARGLIEEFRAEQKKREEKEKEIPDIQLKILRWLPSEHGGEPLSMEGIRHRANIPMDETEIHVNRLQKAGLITWQYNTFGERVWRRTISGSELVVAKRLAGEEKAEEKRKRYKRTDLPTNEQLVLLKVAKSDGITTEELAEQLQQAMPTLGKPIFTVPTVTLFLVILASKKMVASRDATGGVPATWVVLEEGTRCLADCGLI